MNAAPTQKRLSLFDTFAQLRSAKKLAFMPFISAGYPDLETTKAVLPALEQAGANLIEIGIPFSDPIADGPTIQESYTIALQKKLKLTDIFAMVREVRPRLSVPLVSMVSYSIVYRYGLERFLRDAKQAGFDGLILPDLPPPEAQDICRHVQSAGLDTILLVAPTTPAARRAEICKLSSGFVYYLSVSGITGERQSLPADLSEHLAELRRVTEKPICVGFGISRPEHVQQLIGHADGAIVGSAIVKRMTQHREQGPAAVAKAVADYCRELLAVVR